MVGESGEKGKYLKVVGGGGDTGKYLKVVGGGGMKSITNTANSTVNQPRTNTLIPPPNQHKHSTCTNINVAILDSGASHHCTSVNIPCTNKRPCLIPYSVSLPDSSVIHAIHTAILDLPRLSLFAHKSYLSPDLNDRALVSVAQFCDNNYNVLFTPTHVSIIRNNIVVLTGTRAQPQSM